ncbi:DNA ligase, partial [bacterium]|nr:DNA ligase [bacterium]
MPAMLAKTYEGENPKGWLMSEKLDGVRALWNGRELMTRNGNVILAPGWCTSALPAVSLDGELWAGRGGFQRVLGIIRGTG